MKNMRRTLVFVFCIMLFSEGCFVSCRKNRCDTCGHQNSGTPR